MRRRRDVSKVQNDACGRYTARKSRRSLSLGSLVGGVLKGVVLCTLCVISGVICFLLYTGRLGFARPFPAQPLLTSVPLLPSHSIDIVATLKHPPGNIAVSRSGRVFFTFHPEYKPPLQVAELLAFPDTSSSFTPYPNMKYNSEVFKSCLSLHISYEEHDAHSEGLLWILDFSSYAVSRLWTLSTAAPTLFSFYLTNNTLHGSYEFPDEVAGPGSMLNDFSVDVSRRLIYISDTSLLRGSPALIVYDYSSRTSYRLLSAFGPLLGAPYSFSMLISPTRRGEVTLGPFGITIGVDSIALDRNSTKLYFAALSSNRLYSLTTQHIDDALKIYRESGASEADTYLSPLVKLQSKDKPISDGITTDCSGNILLTAVEHAAIAVTTQPTHGGDKLITRILLQNTTLLRWTDGLSFGPDGLYITSSALHYRFMGQPVSANAPFHITRISAVNIAAVTGCSATDLMILAGR